MPLLARIVASPLLAGAVAVGAAQGCSTDPCRPPVFIWESTNRATLPGPHTPECKAAREEQLRKQNEQPPENRP
jgi:hypothetical protein